MERFLDKVKRIEDLHHAYLFVGEVMEIKNELRSFFENKLKVKINGNPDFSILTFENLSVDDAKNIRDASEKKNFGEYMMFLLSFDSISMEAQNSLLKTLEEPSENTYFFLVSPQDNVLPTLKSRMQVVDCRNSDDATMSESIMNLSLTERLQRVKDLVEAISDEESTKQEAINFLNSIEAELHSGGVEKNRDALVVCQNARVYILDRGAPIKMILENLVLNI